MLQARQAEEDVVRFTAELEASDHHRVFCKGRILGLGFVGLGSRILGSGFEGLGGLGCWGWGFRVGELGFGARTCL